MTDKERLEIIKMDNERYHQEVVFSSQVLNDIKWLINRVEELEIKLSINTNNMKNLQNKIERYKQALEFYANKENHVAPFLYTGNDDIPVHDESEVDMDEGKIARQALGQEESK